MKYLVFGMKVTGISTVKTLCKFRFDVSYYDGNPDPRLKEELKGFSAHQVTDIESEISNYQVMVKSPGIRNDNPIVKLALEQHVKVISDLELAYLLFCDRKLIAVTGTNGKTTTTSLLVHILNQTKFNAHAVGNIGKGMLWELYCGSKDDFYVIETSSFQLENTNFFSTHIAGILNVTPDHIDWHGSFENYVSAKKKIYRNQRSSDYFVWNEDDEISTHLTDIPACQYTISLHSEVARGVFRREDHLYYRDLEEEMIIPCREIPIVGDHNIQNTMMAICLAKLSGATTQEIQKGIRTFRGISHRLEFVAEENGVRYYNDSKGTNIDASIKAIQSFSKNILLIAGGYDKKVSFDPFVEAFENRVKHLYIMGQTTELIQQACEKNSFFDFTIVSDLREAVEKAKLQAEPGDTILLSPACASWGMYENYEERGNEFKRLVR